MPIGFELFRPGTTSIMIDSERIAARVVTSGAVTLSPLISAEIPLPPGVANTAPLVLLRPAADVAVGAVVQLNDRYLVLGSAGGYCQWAVVSDVGAPVLHGTSGVGMELRNSAGQVTYSSSHRHPRIVQIASSLIPAWGINGAPYFLNLSVGPFPSRPWMVANDLIYSWETSGGLGGGASFPQHAYGARLNAASNVLTYEARSGDNFSTTGFGFQASYSPYQTRPLRVPLCILPGY